MVFSGEKTNSDDCCQNNVYVKLVIGSNGTHMADTHNAVETKESYLCRCFNKHTDFILQSLACECCCLGECSPIMMFQNMRSQAGNGETKRSVYSWSKIIHKTLLIPFSRLRACDWQCLYQEGCAGSGRQLGWAEHHPFCARRSVAIGFHLVKNKSVYLNCEALYASFLHCVTHHVKRYQLQQGTAKSKLTLKTQPQCNVGSSHT